ncbi:MAG TPA: hypothetical protein DF699_11085, partial [Phycisphaerales bacterium]|nr:hypothetical protein [Phycisphaerales bacterium]
EQAVIDELQRVQFELLQIRQENQRLKTQIDYYERGDAITPQLNVKQVTRPRIANLTGDLLLVRTGSIEGLSQG